MLHETQLFFQKIRIPHLSATTVFLSYLILSLQSKKIVFWMHLINAGETLIYPFSGESTYDMKKT